jgi:hypothetical protein
LAGIEDYGCMRRTFHVKENECPERFLVGFVLELGYRIQEVRQT